MNGIEVRNAISEAERFIDKAKDALNCASKVGGVEVLNPGKESGALRRASMDLTRALADMRRPIGRR
jgi:hypothetical protein